MRVRSHLSDSNWYAVKQRIVPRAGTEVWNDLLDRQRNGERVTDDARAVEGGITGHRDGIGAGRDAGIACRRMVQVTIALRAGSEPQAAGGKKRQEPEHAQGCDSRALAQRTQSSQRKNAWQHNCVCGVRGLKRDIRESRGSRWA